MAVSEAVRSDMKVRKFFGDSCFIVDLVEQTGDCFYKLLSDVLRPHMSNVFISDLRRVVSAAATADTFSSYKALAACATSSLGADYSFMHTVDTLEQLQDLFRKTAADVGMYRCIWADDFAIQVLSTRYNIVFLIINECHKSARGRAVPHVVSPEHQGTFVQYIILMRTRGAHYNLVRHKGLDLLSQDDLAPSVRDAFSLSLPQTINEPATDSVLEPLSISAAGKCAVAVDEGACEASADGPVDGVQNLRCHKVIARNDADMDAIPNDVAVTNEEPVPKKTRKRRAQVLGLEATVETRSKRARTAR